MLVTKPLLVPIVATPVLPLIHVPPVVPSFNVVVDPPRHSPVLPLIASMGLTVTMAVAAQPDVPV